MNSNILNHIFTLSISIVSSGFIGSSSKICTVGNISTKSNLKEHRTEIIDTDSSSKLASVDMNGLCSAAEVLFFFPFLFFSFLIFSFLFFSFLFFKISLTYTFVFYIFINFNRFAGMWLTEAYTSQQLTNHRDSRK